MSAKTHLYIACRAQAPSGGHGDSERAAFKCQTPCRALIEPPLSINHGIYVVVRKKALVLPGHHWSSDRVAIKQRLVTIKTQLAEKLLFISESS